MVISQGPSGSAMLQALASHRPGKFSPVVVLAIGLSAALHLAGVLYLYNMNWTPPVEETEPAHPAIVFERWVTPRPPTRPVEQTHVARTTNPPLYDTPIVTLPAEPEMTDQPQKVADIVSDFGTEKFEPIVEPAKVIGRPEWIEKPTGMQLARAYPRRAAEAGVSGTATLRCVVDAGGGVRNCAVISEAPAGWGFADAATKLSRYFRMKPQTSDGMPVDGAEVMVPLSFKIAG